MGPGLHATVELVKLGRLSTIAVASAAPVWWGVQHRASAAVRGWQPSRLPGQPVGELYVRSAGAGDSVVVLLHGLVATGAIFGSTFDVLANANRLVVPDLLGFGRSLDERRTRLEPDDHLDALDRTLSLLGLNDRPIVIGAHSMGAALALRWAARRGEQVTRIVCWGAPVYADRDAADGALSDTGLMTRLFAANTAWARAACRWNCHHRTLSGWIAAGLTPELPVPIARAASLHTWPAYRDAMDRLVGRTDWIDLTRRINAQGTSLKLVWGDSDRIGDKRHAQSLIGSEIEVVNDAGHHLPMTHGSRCISQLQSR